MDLNHFDSNMSGESRNSDERRNQNDEHPDEHALNPHHILVDDHRASLGDEESAPGHHMPPLPERTLKEQLVERERQARVETERARLKRQFALSNGGAGEGDNQFGGLVEEEESVAGTLGAGSSIAAANMEFDHPKEDEQELGYAMERFLSEKNTVSTAGGNTVISPPPEVVGGVVMERFLSEPVVVEPVQDINSRMSIDIDDAPSAAIDDHPEVENDVFSIDQHLHHSEVGTAGSIRSYSPVSEGDIVVVNNSMVSLENLEDALTEDGRHSNFGSHEPSSPLQELESSISFSQQSDQPRLFRLTEREIQEMAAIEEASIGNAPPSERDDEFSEVGDLVDNFQEDLGQRHLGPFSERTHTTASFSNTTPLQSHASVEGCGSASVSSVLSPGGATSVASNTGTANHPSEIAQEEIAPSIRDHRGENAQVHHQGHFIDDAGPLDVMVSVATNSAIVNRKMRPGTIMTPPRASISSEINNGVRRSISMPAIVDGFDYDKFDGGTPFSAGQDSLRDLPGDDLWSPASAMNVSPLNEREVIGISSTPQHNNIPMLHCDEEVGSGRDSLDARYHFTFGTTSPVATGLISRGPYQNNSTFPTETEPLVGYRESKMIEDSNGICRYPKANSLLSRAESLFSSIRSIDPIDLEEETNECDKYRRSSLFARAFPERLLALIVTLIVEIPVLLMVSGGSDRLCSLLGRKRYQLMMGFLPLSSAISGNCGLQASTLTTRAISHEHVTLKNYSAWLRTEVGAAAILGLGMGSVLGTLGFILSGMDLPFGLTIFTAQFISILTAGLTGTLAPLIFTFIFRRDAGKWGGPLETAIQDIVGSFTMVVMSYRLLLLFSPMEVDPSDLCGME